AEREKVRERGSRLDGSAPVVVLFFFQAEDGIRDLTVTGVQTCALPISTRAALCGPPQTATVRTGRRGSPAARTPQVVSGSARAKIGRASCREREEMTAEDSARVEKMRDTIPGMRATNQRDVHTAALNTK